MMQRRHMEAIAQAVRKARADLGGIERPANGRKASHAQDAIHCLIAHLADVCAENPRFDRGRFADACWS